MTDKAMREKIRARICKESCGSDCIYRTTVCEPLVADVLSLVREEQEKWDVTNYPWKKLVRQWWTEQQP